MADIVKESYDFEEVMKECLINYGDNSLDTRENRINDWLWYTKSNRTIGDSKISDEEFQDAEKSDLTEVLHQISEFTDKTDKEIMCFYLIVTYPNNLGNIKLDTDLSHESMNIENQEINDKIVSWESEWVKYEDRILKWQVKALKEILNPDIVEDMYRSAPNAFKDITISNLQKQLGKRGYSEEGMPEEQWDELYKKVREVKGTYRAFAQNKESTVAQLVGLIPKSSEDKGENWQEFLLKAIKLKNSISRNLAQEGISTNGIIC